MALFTAIGTALGASAVAGTGLFGASAAATIGAGITAGVGATAFSMMNQPKQSQQQQAQMPSAPEAPKMADASKIAQQQATDRQRAAARSESVKTNPLGIKDEAEVVRKKLLGT